MLYFRHFQQPDGTIVLLKETKNSIIKTGPGMIIHNGFYSFYTELPYEQ